MTPEGCRRLAGGVSHREATHLHSSPGRGDRFGRERLVSSLFRRPCRGGASSDIGVRWLSPPANFRCPSGTREAASHFHPAPFIALAKRLAKEGSGFQPEHLARLDEFFQQWLYQESRPVLTPSTFFVDLPPRLSIRLPGVNEVELAWSPSIAGWSLEESGDLESDSWTPVLSLPVVANGESKVILERQPIARFYRLRRD